MSGCVKGLVDSSVTLYMREDNEADWEKMVNITNVPLPKGNRATDDVTPVDSHFKVEVASGVVSYDALEIEGLFVSTGEALTQQTKAQKWFINGTCLEFLIVMNDTDKTSFDGCCSITKIGPTRDATKKTRRNMTLAVSGEVKHRIGGKNILSATDSIELPAA